MDPRNDRTSVVRSRLLEILSSRMQPTSSTAAASGPPNSNAPSTITSLSSSEETARGMPQDKSPSLPQIPPLAFGSVGPDETARRALTPIHEASGSERDASRRPTVEMALPSPPRPGDGSGANTTPGPRPSMERREEPDVPSSAQISPSAYTPSEEVSVTTSPPHEKPEESATSTSIPKPSPEAGMSLTGGGPSEPLTYDDSRTLHVDRVSSPPSVHNSLRSSVASPPSLSPANSSNPPASLSPGQALHPRTPSPKFSILTSPHSLDSPARPNQSFAELGVESLGRQSLTSPTVLSAASLEPSKLSQDSIQASTDSSRDRTHAIYDEGGALYYLHQPENDSLDAIPEPAREEDDDLSPTSGIPHPSQYVQPTTAPLRPKTASPPPLTASSGRSFPSISIDTAHRKPPIQQLPRTPTLDYGPEKRPAGARAAPVSNRQDSVTASSSAQPPRNLSTRIVGNIQQGNMSQIEDPDADAFAALTFLEQHGDDTSVAPAQSGPSTAASPPSHPREGPPTISEPPNIRPPTPEGENASVYKSSFAPSKNAMQRKARTEAQQAAHEAATHRPGRGTGKPKNKLKAVETWGDSSEEEEEEEEEDDDVDSDGQPVAPRDDRSVSNYAASVNQRSQVPSPRGPSPFTSGVGTPPPTQPIPRPPRNLPPVPVPRGQGLSLVFCLLCPCS